MKSEETRYQLPESSPVTQKSIIPPATSCDNACELLSGRKFVSDSVPRIFIERLVM